MISLRNFQNILNLSCPLLISLLLHNVSSKRTSNRLLNCLLMDCSNTHLTSDSSNKKIICNCKWSKSLVYHYKLDKHLNCREIQLDIWVCFQVLLRRCSMIKKKYFPIQVKVLYKNQAVLYKTLSRLKIIFSQQV